ncbi:hypothetical protein HNQ59_001494 [Chitinivorax tropicus]|uniref:DUF3617 family protein n=1 Tax=Chitinivorax tropicus TaxID=714531 RepID=A0A840MM53_9PROT|nr:DUF3617 family protein [Chitinivorax tropicus]MBB5018209.1 hypothetical protein [Chitinivorax tropicus]
MLKYVMWCLLSAASASAVAGVQAGQWEFTVKNEMEGLPPSQHPLKLNKCIAAEDVDNLLKIVPMVPGATPDSCEVANRKDVAGKATFTLNCIGYPKVSAEGAAQLGATSVSGNTKAVLDSNTYKKNLNQTYTGKRMGDCK